MVDQIQNLVGIAPLVVVPGDQFHKILIEHDARFGIEDGGSGVGAVSYTHLGWVERPTLVNAQAPNWPTIIRSTIEASCVKSSSTQEGHAI